MQQDDFSLRHIGPSESDTKKMLSSLEVESIEELLTQTIPEEIRLKSPLSLPKGISENKFLNELRALSDENKYLKLHWFRIPPHSYTGCNPKKYFRNPGWYTAYTPYQAEIAQGD